MLKQTNSGLNHCFFLGDRRERTSRQRRAVSRRKSAGVEEKKAASVDGRITSRMTASSFHETITEDIDNEYGNPDRFRDSTSMGGEITNARH